MNDILNVVPHLVTRAAAQLNHAVPGASTVLAWAVGGLAALVLGLIVAGATLRFLRWAVAALLSGLVQGFRGVVAFIGVASRWLAAALRRAAVLAVAKTWQGLAAGARAVFTGLRDGLRPGPGGGLRREPSLAAGMAGADDDAPADEYAAAIELLGLNDVWPLTRDAVKRQHAAMLRSLAAQKSAAARAMAKEANAALDTILQAHGWR